MTIDHPGQLDQARPSVLKRLLQLLESACHGRDGFVTHALSLAKYAWIARYVTDVMGFLKRTVVHDVDAIIGRISMVSDAPA